MIRAKGFLRSCVLIFIVYILSRSIIRSLPGDPLDTLIAESGTQISREALATELRLDLPFLQSLIHDLQSGLGRSLVTREPVLETLSKRLLSTLLLSSSALFIALFLAIVGTLGSALRSRDSHYSKGLRFFAHVATTIPTAWIGPVVLYSFGVALPWAEFRNSFPLACLTLSIPITGYWIRLLSLRIQQEREELYFRSAMGKGLSLPSALIRHALAPAAGALFAILGSQWGALLAGTFLVEHIFDCPGLGSTWIQAVQQRDYPMIEGATFIGATTCLLGIQLGDWMQAAWDPRIADEGNPS